MAENNRLSEEERYQFIGFERFGKKSKPLFKDDEERQRHVANVKNTTGSVFRNSVIYAESISLVDRAMITIASLVMVIAPFLVWFKAATLYGPVTFTGLTGIMNTGGFWFYVEMMGGSIIPLTVYLTTVMAYLSVLFGIMTLVFLFLPAKSEAGLVSRLKMVMRAQLVPVFIFLAIIVIGLVGQRIPFGPHLGIDGLGRNYSIFTFVQFSYIGFWLSLFGFIINFNKSKEL
jgi:hypothetical protein